MVNQQLICEDFFIDFFLERLIVVNEYYERNLECLINEKQFLTIEQIQQWTYQILYALIYLQEKQLHTRNLSLKNIRLTQSVKKRFSRNFIGRFASI
jgi:serine/threonine protein kinase